MKWLNAILYYMKMVKSIISCVWPYTNSKEAHLTVTSVGNCISCDACTHVHVMSCLYICMSSLYSDVCIGAAVAQNRNLVKKHTKKQGSLPVQSLKLFLTGPSCVGKTTARRRLTEEITNISCDEIVPSTGIDAPVTVELYHPTEQSSLLLSTGWRCQGLEEQLICETEPSEI